MTGRPKTLSPWWQMISGMRAYGVAITVVWALCATTVLLVLTVTARSAWERAALLAGSALELCIALFTVRFLIRGSIRGRFDV